MLDPLVSRPILSPFVDRRERRREGGKKKRNRFVTGRVSPVIFEGESLTIVARRENGSSTVNEEHRRRSLGRGKNRTKKISVMVANRRSI